MSSNAKKRNNAKAAQKKPNYLPVIAVAAVVVCAAVVFFLNGRNTAENGTAGNAGSGDSTVIASGESLVIPTAEITSDASFFPLEVDGTTMEVIAVRASDGTIRTAFNTCQVCYDSGRGYYVQSGNYLVCQNCGNRFSMDQVEIVAGGCNPWPIFPENKTVTADEISISYDFFVESQGIFENWKRSY